ncbi:hypothetical protein K474DRAFT_714542 [Panus rudis PR-1116 ss-1]|nr:hypothetical protein K474DRAFT_714542 [Panus rudis PR-1116 ss-1]
MEFEVRVRRKGELRKEGENEAVFIPGRLAGWLRSCALPSIVECGSTIGESQPRDERDASSGRIRATLSTAPNASRSRERPSLVLTSNHQTFTYYSVPARLSKQHRSTLVHGGQTPLDVIGGMKKSARKLVGEHSEPARINTQQCKRIIIIAVPFAL